MDKFVKRIQTRLSRQGFSFNKQQIREAYQSLVKDHWAPTEAEMNSVINKLKFQLKTSFASSTQLTISEDLVEQIEKPETLEITPSSHPDIWETLQPPMDSASSPTAEQTSLSVPEHQELVTKQEPLSEAPLAKTESNLPVQQTIGGISQIEVTQAIAQAIQQVGEQGNAEAVELLTSLANELTDDIKDTQEMVTALVTAYLGKRQVLLSSAIGTLNTLRSAQTESFQAGLDEDFFGQKQKNKEAFLIRLSAMFN
jgi:hypothetical protein